MPARAAAALGMVMTREQQQKWNLVGQWAMRGGVLIALAAVLTACGSQPESAPATTAPAATTAAPTSAPATTAADDEDEADAATAVAEDEDEAATAASPVADAATPVGMAAATPVGMVAATPGGMAAATPIGAGEMMASPVAGAAEATPVHRNRDNKATPVGEVALTEEQCAAYLAWLDDPDVKAALAYAADWPLIVAEGEKLAAGEPVDTEAMKALAKELDGQANVLREAGTDATGHDSVAFAGKAMGLASRMAAGLADGTRTQAEAGDDIVELKAAIARYEEDAAARQAACA